LAYFSIVYFHGIPLNLSNDQLIRRLNRSIFEGIADERIQRCDCPATGSIGHVDNFHGMLSLFTPAIDSKKLTTQGSVDTISLNCGIDWICINQNRING
jgi:DNA-binding sugar fermentation-stimulating protein